MIHISNANIINPVGGEVREHSDILIEGGRIVRVGAGLEPDSEDRVIDAGNMYAIPGMVCGHHHFYSGLARGITADIGATPDFPSILARLWWRLDRALDEEDIRLSSLICAIDAIRSGTTAVIDHHSSPSFIEGSLDLIAEGFEKTGLRGATCYEVTDRNGREGMLAGIEENRRFAARCASDAAAAESGGRPDAPLIGALVGGHAPFTLPDEALERLGELCNESGAGFHVHTAEDRYDVSHSHAVHRKDLIPRLAEYGLLKPGSILAHGLYLRPDEIEIINDAGAFLAHNPRSNMNNSVGYNGNLPLYGNLVLGTDGIGADMFEEFKFAAFKHRDAGGSWFPGDLMPMLNGANRILEGIFNRRFGQIREGYAADIVLLDYNSPTPLIGDNFAGHLAFGLSSRSVHTVIINGKPVMENRSFPFDISEIYRKARERAPRIWKKLEELEA